MNTDATTAATEDVRFDLHFHDHEQLVQLACAAALFLERFAGRADAWSMTLAEATLDSVADELAAR